MNPYERVVQLRKRSGRVITHYWAKAVAAFRGREFFAEFLATFVLVVSGAFAGCLLVESIVPRIAYLKSLLDVTFAVYTLCLCKFCT